MTEQGSESVGNEKRAQVSQRIRLVIVRGESKGEGFDIEQGENQIGRWDPETGAFPDIDLEKFDVEAKVSRKHAIIFRDGNKLAVEDTGSLNGTFVNRSDRLEAGKRVDLKPGDEIIIGKTFLRLEVE